jgi:hypothetical protein
MKEEKHSNVTLSTKSWHYRLIHYVLGSNAPTPDNMFNLCPYFWLMIFSMFASIFVAPVKITKQFFSWLGKMYMKYITLPAAKRWYSNLTDYNLFLIFEDSVRYGSERKMNALGFDKWELRESWFKDNKDFTPLDRDLYKEWYDKYIKIFNKFVKEKDDRIDNRRAIIVHTINFIENPINRFFDKVSEKWNNFKTKYTTWQSIIKYTKRFTGLLITVSGLFVTFFIVQFSSLCINYLLDWISSVPASNWLEVLLVIIYLISIFVIAFGIGTLIQKITKKITEIYIDKSFGELNWLEKLSYYILKVLDYLIVVFIWTIIIRSIGKSIWVFLKYIGRSIKSFFGIFREYFGSSYTDYCPGIDWEQEKDSE